MIRKKLICSILVFSVFAFTACSLKAVESEDSEDSEETTTESIDETSVESVSSETSSETSLETSETTTIETTTSETTTAPTEPDYYSLYQPVVDVACDMLVSGPDPDADELPEGMTGVMEAYQVSDDKVGYVLVDLNGDGISELVIGSDYIMCIYTLVDGKPVLVKEGWGRNQVYLLESGKIYLEGSAGASYSITEVFEFKPNESALTLTDLYYTWPDESGESTVCFHNTTGKYPDGDGLPWQDAISREEYMDVFNSLQSQIVEIEYTDIFDFE